MSFVFERVTRWDAEIGKKCQEEYRQENQVTSVSSLQWYTDQYSNYDFDFYCKIIIAFWLNNKHLQ